MARLYIKPTATAHQKDYGGGRPTGDPIVSDPNPPASAKRTSVSTCSRKSPDNRAGTDGLTHTNGNFSTKRKSPPDVNVDR